MRVLLFAQSLRRDRTGRERIHRDAAPSVVIGEALRHRNDARTRRTGVHEVWRAAIEGIDVDDVHDRTEPALQHARRDPADHVPGAVEVQIDDRAPAIVGEFTGTHRKLPTGVVDEEISRTTEVGHCVRERLHVLQVADVRRHCKAAPAQRLDLGPGGVQRFLVTPGDNHVRTEARERQGNLASDPATTAGHDRGPALEEAFREG